MFKKQIRLEINAIRQELDILREKIKYFEELDMKESKSISEEIIMQNNCETAFKQGTEAKEIEYKDRIQEIIDEIEKSKSKMLRKQTVINYLEKLQYTRV